MIYNTERQMSGSSYIENLKHMQWESVHMITKKRGTCSREELGDSLGSFAKNLTINCHCLQRLMQEGLSIKCATFLKQVHFFFFCHELLGSSHHTLQNPA